jgi:hypothetical protein
MPDYQRVKLNSGKVLMIPKSDIKTMNAEFIYREITGEQPPEDVFTILKTMGFVWCKLCGSWHIPDRHREKDGTWCTPCGTWHKTGCHYGGEEPDARELAARLDTLHEAIQRVGEVFQKAELTDEQAEALRDLLDLSR